MFPSPPAARSRHQHVATRLHVKLRLVSIQPAPMLPTLVQSTTVGLAMLMLAGCAKMDAALSQRWVDVSFKAGTSVAQVLHIRTACSHVPNVTAAPIPRNQPALDIVQSIRFYTTRASDGNVAELQTCLTKFPAVIGIDPQDASDSGG